MYEITWSKYAEYTFSDEADFILTKWSQTEVENFFDLVDYTVSLISKNPFIGKPVGFNRYALVLSKQTTLYYKVFEQEKHIELLLFWNNLQNPDKMKKYL